MRNISTFIGTLLAVMLLTHLPVWALDFTISDPTPSLILNDTDLLEGNWLVETDEACNQCFDIYNWDTATYPFIIEDGAASNLLFLDAAEHIGINTNTPAYTVDARGDRISLGPTSGTRRIALMASGTDVDLLGENANLYLRSPNNDIIINPFDPVDGFVGVGTTNPAKKLHVYGGYSGALSNNMTAVRIENVNATTTSRHMLQLVNRGNPLLWFHNTQNDIRWSMNPIDTSFVFSRGGSGGYEMQLYSSGDLVIRGSLTQNSDRNTKKNIEAVNPVQVLETVAELPISSWQFKNDTEKSRHLGPMAQDFYAAFGLGRDEKGIAPGDMSGVALAAIKGLYTIGKEKDAKIAELETIAKKKDTKIAHLEEQLKAQQEQIAKLSALEHVVTTLVEQVNAQGPMKVSFETNPVVNN